MDGLSAAASGIAVVSLAVQLVDSVREMRRFFRTLKDAPDELDRLLDLLEHMELMLENIGKLVDPDSDISPSVLKAMQACEKALTKLGALIQKVKRNASVQSPLKQSLGFFKLACKKQAVEEIEKQLDRAVSSLNMALTALNLHGINRLWTGVSATNAAAATITDVVLRVEATVNQASSKQKLTISNWSRTSRSAICRRFATHKVVYRGFLGTVAARIQSQSEDVIEGEHSKESNAGDEWSWTFIPSFLSRCVQVKCVSSFRSVERTLRTCPILPVDHPVWNICLSGDISSLQELFSTREISPYSINKHGESLLHFAATFLRSDICDLLLRMGVGVDVVDAFGRPVTGWVIDETCDEIESTYRSFTAANYDRDLAYFCTEYFESCEHLSVEDFRSRVETWVTEENVNLFIPSPLVVVTSRLCDFSIDQIEFHKWKDITVFLIAKKANLHGIESYDEKFCLLELMVASMVHPFDAHTVGARFLEMLNESNVDLAEYLMFERKHHQEGLLTGTGLFWVSWWHPDLRQVKLHIEEEQPFLLSWDWWVDPKETAFLVLHEFRHFGRAGNRPSYGYRHRDSSYWPFVYQSWDLALDEWRIEEDMALVKCFQQRFDRRWQKKMIKQAKIQGTHKKPKMPGSWID